MKLKKLTVAAMLAVGISTMSFASAMASLSSETACITAETIGMFIVRGHFSPAFLLNFTTGVQRLTLSGTQSADE